MIKKFVLNTNIFWLNKNIYFDIMKKNCYNENILLNLNLFLLNWNIFWYNKKKSDIIKIYIIECKLIFIKYILISHEFLFFQYLVLWNKHNSKELWLKKYLSN